jgi:hypothetical protein
MAASLIRRLLIALLMKAKKKMVVKAKEADIVSVV